MFFLLSLIELHFLYGMAVGLALCARPSTSRQLEALRQMNPKSAHLFTKKTLFITMSTLGLLILVNSILKLLLAFMKRNKKWTVIEGEKVVLKDVNLREAEAVVQTLMKSNPKIVSYDVDVTNHVVTILSMKRGEEE